jgi:hypothetical protein
MNITSKHNLKDPVFVLINNKVLPGKIRSIHLNVGEQINKEDAGIVYTVSFSASSMSTFKESNVFATKKGLLNSL